MDISSTGAAGALAQQAHVQTQSQISVMKQANTLQGQLALSLVEAVTAPSAANPPNMGQHIDVHV